MTSGIEFFLTQCVQSADKHDKKWAWYILDSERLQQDIIQILINVSPPFCESLFGFVGECKRQPVGGLFDLVVKSDSGNEVFVEIKCDQDWSYRQRDRQVEYLSQSPNARCAVLLFSQRSSTIRAADVQAVGSSFFKVSSDQIFKALDALLQSTISSELNEFASAYKVALEAQYERTKFRGDPNG
jgi:hypothetical protein